MAIIPKNTLTYALPAPTAAIEPGSEGVTKEASSYFSKGFSLMQQEKYLEALEAFDRALEYREDFPNAWYNKGLALGSLGRYQETLDPYKRALGYKENFPQAWNNLGLALCLLGRLREAQRAFQSAFGLKEGLSDGGTELCRIWSELTLAQGLDALLSQNLRDFEEAGLKYIDILEKAQQDGMGQVVEDALTQFKCELKKKKEQRAFAELETFISLMKIKDPFEGWRAIGKVISERWPKGLDCVQAVREMRR